MMQPREGIFSLFIQLFFLEHTLSSDSLCFKGVLHSILGPDILGLTAATYETYIVGNTIPISGAIGLIVAE